MHTDSNYYRLIGYQMLSVTAKSLSDITMCKDRRVFSNINMGVHGAIHKSSAGLTMKNHQSPRPHLINMQSSRRRVYVTLITLLSPT